MQLEEKQINKEKENVDDVKLCVVEDAEYEELLQYLGVSSSQLCDVAPNPQKCSAREYVEYYIFPVLLPALNKMLTSAKENLVFERKRTKFNPCDFLTEYLYNHNPYQEERENRSLWDIPFVQEILKRKPRPPLPLSLVWSEEEAATVIQSGWRGYIVRKDPEVQELRQYQQDMRESSYHIMFRVEDFWKQHPVEDVDKDDEVMCSTEVINSDEVAPRHSEKDITEYMSSYKATSSPEVISTSKVVSQADVDPNIELM
ncbi:IQ domain-containing protein K-like [Hydractinia symbiolongicarpus]|uniref:IQ domain-containing protein K-like n=1 Tax=Hydractinia symbiolongicarpus TaxID=13093 RepID=UPI00254CC10E|nr:IQ domain-containing protein K-like [Hydractinia symbiolongicarpus]